MVPDDIKSERMIMLRLMRCGTLYHGSSGMICWSGVSTAVIYRKMKRSYLCEVMPNDRLPATYRCLTSIRHSESEDRIPRFVSTIDEY